MGRLRVLICDVDGTLVDSAAGVMHAVASACGAVGVPVPPEPKVRQQIGLSLDVMFDRLFPDAPAPHKVALVVAYRDAYFRHRHAEGSRAISPLFPGAEAALRRLAADPWVVLAIATGKSRRGVDALVADHGLDGLFISVQTADTHPSKPHPSMIHAILRETGADADAAAMLGDTLHDSQMARAARVPMIGVAWGYHPAVSLGADYIIDRFDALDGAFAAATKEKTKDVLR